MATLNFNANDVEPGVGFEPIPAGEYIAAIVASETKATRAGTGNYLELSLQILEGPHKGRMLWSRLNLENPSATAVRIARAELSAICRAVNVMAPKDSCELHNIPLVIKVGVTERNDNGEPTNEIKGYSRRQAQPPTPSAIAGTPPPWKRG